MTADPNPDIARIFAGWHRAVVDRDLDGLTALYAEDALFESPLVWAVRPEGSGGILHGKAAIHAFFAEVFRSPANGLGRWYRTGVFFANGRQLTWEYPRETPEGDQIDLVEVMDVSGGLIAQHRVYWGWVGVQTLSEMTARRPAGSGSG